ncbi:MAG: cytochrome c biogenesis protein CcdA [Gemmataceae bacterium]
MSIYLLLVGLAVAGGPTQDPFGELSAVGKKVIFTSRIEAAEPFSPMNQVGSKPVVRRGETFLVVLAGSPQDGWYTYPATQRGQDQAEGQVAKITVRPPAGLVPLYPLRESTPKWKEIGSGLGWEMQHQGPFTWTQVVFVDPKAKPGKYSLTYQLDLQVCKSSCLPEKQDLTVEVEISGDEALDPPVDIRSYLTTPPPTQVLAPPATNGTGNGQASGKPGQPGKNSEVGLGVAPVATSNQAEFSWLPIWARPIAIALLSGFLSLLTPCVFPMIPITVSYFIKQAEAKQGSAVGMALIYSGTIALVLILGGLALVQVLNAVINHPVTNFALALLFIYFALSLLGWYDITLPSWLQDWTASGENKGGLMGVFFMALTFSIISFACVGPIYGGFLTLKAGTQSDMLSKVVSVVAFSVAFASPFFVLALFPTLLRSMPRAGSWMNSVKVVMGFLELAAAVKFLRSGELLSYGAGSFFSYSACMAMYVGLCLACALYLFGVFRLPHDHDAPETLSVPRSLFAIGFLSLGLYLVPGIFPMKDADLPSKGIVFGWVDSFLLPEPGKKSSGGSGDEKELPWYTDLQEGLSRARAEKKLVFLDFTGINCTNCKLNERNIFSRPEIQARFARHVLVQLYADQLPAGLRQSPDVAGAVKLRSEIFQSDALPLYALLRPTSDGFEVVSRYGMNKGIIDPADIPAFIAFLEQK